MLLNAGADVELAKDNGFTSLMKASQNGHEHVARALLENGAAVNSQNNKGWTALMWAAFGGHDQVRNSQLAGNTGDPDPTSLLWLSLEQLHRYLALCLNKCQLPLSGGSFQADNREIQFLEGGRYPVLRAAASKT